MPQVSKRTPELVEEILDRICNGELYYQMWRSDPDKFPTIQMLAKWRKADDDFNAAYLHAQAVGAETLVQQAVVIMDAEPERVLYADADGNYTKPGGKRDAASVAWQRFRADLRLKYAPFFNPKFNPKLDIGSDPERPLQVETGIAARIALALRTKARGGDPEPVLIEHQEPDGSDLV